MNYHTKRIYDALVKFTTKFGGISLCIRYDVKEKLIINAVILL